MKFNEVEIKVVNFEAANAFAFIEGGAGGSGDDL